MEYKVQIKRLEFWLWVRPQCSYRMNNLSTCNIVCAAEGDNFPLVLLNKWRSFPGPQMLLSECRSRLIRTLTVVILTNMTDKCHICEISDLNYMISFQKLERWEFIGMLWTQKVMKKKIWKWKVMSLILNQQKSDKRTWIWKHYLNCVWNSIFLYNEYEWKT